MGGVCRVPSHTLALRLSILYLRTCVGLGYGKTHLHYFPVPIGSSVDILISNGIRTYTLETVLTLGSLTFPGYTLLYNPL